MPTQRIAVLAAVAIAAASTGCARLCIIFENSQPNADAAISYVLTDADSGEELATGELSAAEQSICYLLKGARRTDQGTAPRNLMVEATYDDGTGNTTTLSTGVFSLGPRESKYVIIDNAEGEPVISVADENDTGIVTSTWQFLPH